MRFYNKVGKAGVGRNRANGQPAQQRGLHRKEVIRERPKSRRGNTLATLAAEPSFQRTLEPIGRWQIQLSMGSRFRENDGLTATSGAHDVNLAQQ